MKMLLTRLGALSIALAAIMFLAPVAGNAQIPIPIPTPTPTPTPDPSPTPTASPSPSPEPSRSPTRGGGSGGGGGSGSKTSGSRSGGGSGPARQITAAERRGIEKWLSRDRTPARTTTRLLGLLDRSIPGKRPPTVAQLREGFGRFPVVGYTWYQDDYGAPRFSGAYSFHAGTDLFAVKGTPVIAVVDGYVWNIGSFSRGGNAVWLMGDDGVRYYYGHLKAYRRDLKIGTRLAVGELLGWVGDTGNAKGTYPHVHFEVNPGGLGTVNPKPILDAWLDAAELAARDRVAAVKLQDRLAPLGVARWDTLFDVLSEPVSPTAALWTSGLDGSTTLTQLDLALATLMGARDWEQPTATGERYLAWDRLTHLLEHEEA